MPKVTNPLFSGDVRGQFGKQLIYTRGGVVRRYFKPRNPNTEAQQAQRQAFKEFSVPGLTQEQADLLYAAIAHLHDDRYSLLGHDHDGDYASISHHHDDEYAAVVHTHLALTPFIFHAGNTSVPASSSRYLVPSFQGLVTTGQAVVMPFAGVMRNLRFRLNTAQHSSGSMVCTVQRGLSTTDLKVTIPASASADFFNNLTDQVSFDAGDFFNVRIDNNATSASGNITSVTMEFAVTAQ